MWCLDNGHGKLQKGKRSPVWEENEREMQLLEYEFNRDIVQRIAQILQNRGIAFYEITPEVEEAGGDLKERVDRANGLSSILPKLFISVHCNAGPALKDGWSDQNGIETWYAVQSRKGEQMASIFQHHLASKTDLRDRGIKAAKGNQMYVLQRTSMPAILTENGFYNNREEVRLLMKDEMRQAIAEAHADAILEIEQFGLERSEEQTEEGYAEDI
jgi:N-acetylmuramoyl-L-alanine amidase